MSQHPTGDEGAGIWPDADLLVRECEDFLAGQSALALRESGTPVPPWAWLNMLAHATRQELVRVAVHGLEDENVPEAWERAVAMIAREVLALADERACATGDVQRDVLVPIELEMTHELGWATVAPGLLVMHVVAALGAYRGAPH
jgi:hypothetical protein